ncbi:uncharacterized protein QYS62_006602 [Fusarium acuminatum]|uniref:C2H2-type domain-containing protein n=1 Tax=Fusarium acuminatum TaxID=5515 RepID=A0ABZ2WXP0_9HYPO
MSGFAKPPAADGAPWIGPEQNQQTTQSETKPQSFGERLRHKGRHYLKKAPRFLHTQSKQPLLTRWRSNSVKVKADVDDQSPPLAVYNPPVPMPVDLRTMDVKNELQGPQQLPWPVMSPPPDDSEAKNAKNELQAPFMFPVQQQQQQQQQPWPASIPQPPAVADNMSSSHAKSHIVKPSNHRRWLKGYTTSRKRVNSAPALSLGLGDLTGVGSQYDATNRPISALPTGTDQSMQVFANPYVDHINENTFDGNTFIEPILPPAWFTQAAEPGEQASFPEPSPSEIDLTRRLSNDTAQGYSTAAESIFTRPSSTISAASTWESSIGRASSSPSQRRSLFRRTLSSTSSLNFVRDSSNSIGGHTVPPIPILSLEMRKRLSLPYHMPAHQQLTATATPTDLIAARVACQDSSLTVSDQVALTGWVAQQRRTNKSPLANQVQDESALDLSETPLPLCNIEVHPGGDPDPELATIEERLSETGLSNEDTVSMGWGFSGDHATTTGSLSISHHLSPRRKSHSVGASTTTDMRSATASNRDFMEQADTPASSVSDIVEEVEDDTSEADESISNVSRETDESLEEAFHATSLDPALLGTVTALKDQITTLVMERVSEWVTTCSPGQDSGQGTTGPPGDSGFHQSNTGQDNNAKKRGLNNDDEDEHANHAGRGNGDDQDKRRKTESPATRVLPNLACPFVKKYPGEKWPKCQKGWPSVHRINDREHIYRSHKAPIHCKRCFTVLKTEKLLELHLRQDQACEVLHPPREMPGIDAETKDRLKSRQEAPMTAEERAQYRSFLRREIPVRVIRDINNIMMTEPRFNAELSERRLYEIISSAVWNAFDAVLPSLLPQIEPPDIPSEHIALSEIAAEHRRQSLPQDSPSTRLQTDLPEGTRELSNVPETIIRSQDPEPPNTYPNDPIADLDMLNPANSAAVDLESLPGGFGSISDDFNFDFSFDFLRRQE